MKTKSTFTEGTEHERERRAGKEAYGRGESEGRTTGRGEDQTVRGEFSPPSGRYGEVSADFGEKPYRAWVSGNTVVPATGTVSYDAQKTAVAFRVPSFVISDAVWVKERGAYTKKNPAAFIEKSEVLYADKKRTVPLLRLAGLTITSQQLLRNGSMGSITYRGQNVKIDGVPFSDVVSGDLYDLSRSAKRLRKCMLASCFNVTRKINVFICTMW